MARFRELFRDSVRGAAGKVRLCEGEGERERRAGAARLVILASDGAEGEVKPLFSCFPGACSCDCGR